jgi:hypothetical protein
MKKTIKHLYNECCKILQNDTGLYHGWINISTSKYGGAVAYAIKNPPEDSDFDLARTSTKHYYAYGDNSLHEVLSKLHGELEAWQLEGKPYDSYKNCIEFEQPVRWKLRQSQFNTTVYLHVAKDNRHNYRAYAVDCDIAGNHYWSLIAPPQDIENDEGWSFEPIPTAESIWEYSKTLEMPKNNFSFFT